MCEKINKLFKKNKNRLISDIVTGDETWVRYLPLQRQFDNEVWMTKCIWKAFSYCQTGSEHMKILFFFAIFLNSEGVLLQFSIFQKRCINSKFCINLHNKFPEPCMKGLLFLHDNAQANKSKLVPEFLSKEVLKSLILLTLQIFPMSHLSLPKT